VPHRDGSEAGGPPGQEHVQRYEGAPVSGKALAHLGAERPEGAHHGGRLGTDGGLQRRLGDHGRQVPPQAVPLLQGRAVDHVEPFPELVHEPGYLLRRVLQVVVHGDDHAEPGHPDAGQQGIVLAIVPHQVDPPDPRVHFHQGTDDLPARIPAAVVHKDEFVPVAGPLQHGVQPGHQVGQDLAAVVHRYHH